MFPQVEVCRQKGLYIVDGSEEEAEEITTKMVARGMLTPLKGDNKWALYRRILLQQLQMKNRRTQMKIIMINIMMIMYMHYGGMVFNLSFNLFDKGHNECAI